MIPMNVAFFICLDSEGGFLIVSCEEIANKPQTMEADVILISDLNMLYHHGKMLFTHPALMWKKYNDVGFRDPDLNFYEDHRKGIGESHVSKSSENIPCFLGLCVAPKTY